MVSVLKMQKVAHIMLTFVFCMIKVTHTAAPNTKMDKTVSTKLKT